MYLFLWILTGLITAICCNVWFFKDDIVSSNGEYVAPDEVDVFIFVLISLFATAGGFISAGVSIAFILIKFFANVFFKFLYKLRTKNLEKK